ncbi:Epoxide hydrolase 1 [Lecanosticta acicola]|uniref:Epoxide hydrolase 1 n=1 Tax=Lecanosticta acicola TaxID=111012 RepID=A0AAI9E5R6_9PEZI|nr:Epoxide hydrolase 1 [Lecanosticta acicola]
MLDAGGDWDMLITRACALLYPQHAQAHHINWVWALQSEEHTNGTAPAPEYTEREKQQSALGAPWSPFGMGDGPGYIAIQSTRPATIRKRSRSRNFKGILTALLELPIFLGRYGPIAFQKLYEKGGHFAGRERPTDIADGLREMFGKGGGAYGVVKGQDGY